MPKPLAVPACRCTRGSATRRATHCIRQSSDRRSSCAERGIRNTSVTKRATRTPTPARVSLGVLRLGVRAAAAVVHQAALAALAHSGQHARQPPARAMIRMGARSTPERNGQRSGTRESGPPPCGAGCRRAAPGRRWRRVPRQQPPRRRACRSAWRAASGHDTTNDNK